MFACKVDEAVGRSGTRAMLRAAAELPLAPLGRVSQQQSHLFTSALQAGLNGHSPLRHDVSRVRSLFSSPVSVRKASGTVPSWLSDLLFSQGSSRPGVPSPSLGSAGVRVPDDVSVRGCLGQAAGHPAASVARVGRSLDAEAAARPKCCLTFFKSLYLRFSLSASHFGILSRFSGFSHACFLTRCQPRGPARSLEAGAPCWWGHAVVREHRQGRS